MLCQKETKLHTQWRNQNSNPSTPASKRAFLPPRGVPTDWKFLVATGIIYNSGTQLCNLTLRQTRAYVQYDSPAAKGPTASQRAGPGGWWAVRCFCCDSDGNHSQYNTGLARVFCAPAIEHRPRVRERAGRPHFSGSVEVPAFISGPCIPGTGLGGDLSWCCPSHDAAQGFKFQVRLTRRLYKKSLCQPGSAHTPACSWYESKIS